MMLAKLMGPKTPAPTEELPKKVSIRSGIKNIKSNYFQKKMSKKAGLRTTADAERMAE